MKTEKAVQSRRCLYSRPDGAGSDFMGANHRSLDVHVTSARGLVDGGFSHVTLGRISL